MTEEQPPEHDFTGTLEEWEERVILNANHFRVHRYYYARDFDVGWVTAHDSKPASTLPEALLLIYQQDSEYRILLYAVTKTGRSVCIPESKWDEVMAKWKDKSAAQSRNPG